MATYIEGLIEKARTAQALFAQADQETVDRAAELICYRAVNPDFARKLSELAVAESRMGDVESKYAKMMNKVRGAWLEMKGRKSVGIIEENEAMGLVKIAKPVGVVGALIPCTNCEATPVLKAAWAIKTRNAMILAPHPRTKETNEYVVDMMRGVLKELDLPEDLLQNVAEVSVANSQELMASCDLILATGGGAMVKAAYSSGTPAYGVGAGNAVTIVDSTQDLDAVANKIMRGKTFDQATSCSSENSVLVEKSVYNAFLEAMRVQGGYLCTSEQKDVLEKAMWPDGHTLNRNIIAQKAQVIAHEAGFSVDDGVSFLMVEESGIGEGYPYSAEKLSVVLTVYTWSDFDEAVDMVNRITAYNGTGHSCGIHSSDRDKVLRLSESVNVSRVMVNQPQSLANSGAWTNGMPITLTLGCGSWGGNISSENISWKHLLNTTWVAWPIESRQIPDEQLFSAEARNR
ncbi:MAG: aldehyde dehydrogenase family protein [Sphaerochaetaceae bacterium]|nr:aldehyde dehydrogenase family protein [Sphaerochaetaceae bacterium]